MLKFNKVTAFIAFGFFTIFCLPACYSQSNKTDDALLKIYRATPAKVNDLVHTKLDVHFDYKKCYLYGKEWVTLKPHIYPTDSLRLDAKGMDLKEISVVQNGKNVPIKFTYDSLTVAIQLDRIYHSNETYTIYIDYTSKPNELKASGSVAINQAKGLYFINPDGADKDKPTQIWTQGETESSSVWFPTIDKPGQKTTDEISMTVPAKYITLSNGRLASQKLNADSTRTDTWKMDLPHSPYLFMMAVGNFKIYHDKWRDKEVNYYLEPKYAPYAKQIFGVTPEIMEFYSKILNYDFPWNKYSQIVVRDYVSGAMENTTATLAGEYVQQTPRELLDANYDEGRATIAHELFHQWFGDLVTAESWSNLTVNESFADLSEMLWAEHKYGRDEADAHSYDEMQQYLKNADNKKKDLVRFHYADKEDMFDGVTYQKGGRILNMLRTYIGNEAFFKGLTIYLKTNAFKTGEAQQLRLAFEETSGLDLNWFFNQWYYGAGNPDLNISYKWDDSAKMEKVYLQQTQQGQIFKLPMSVDIYTGSKKVRRKVWMNNKKDTLTFQLATKPDLVNVDGDKVLLAAKTDNKTQQEYVFQYFNGKLYVDRLEALNAVETQQTDREVQTLMIAALTDKYYGLRIKAIDALDLTNADIKSSALPILDSLAKADKNTLVRAAAITALGKQKSLGYMKLFNEALKSKSYAVQGAALTALGSRAPDTTLAIAKTLEKDNKGALTKAIITVYASSGNSDQWPFVLNAFANSSLKEKFNMSRSLAAMAGRIDNADYTQQGINALKELAIDYKQYDFSFVINNLLNNIKKDRSKLNDEVSAKAASDAMKAVNEAK